MFILNIDRFIAAAEESTQHAFQSLESIVRAFGSISMMLDSTFNAVHSSFRAVLGMADQFSRLRSHLSRVFSALAIFRTAKWAYLKLLYFMGQYDTKYLLCALFCLFIVYKNRSDTTESQHPCFSRCMVNRAGRAIIRSWYKETKVIMAHYYVHGHYHLCPLFDLEDHIFPWQFFGQPRYYLHKMYSLTFKIKLKYLLLYRQD